MTRKRTNEAQKRLLPRQRVRVRDGIHLVTDVYLPADGGPAPAVVTRTPYGRNMPVLLKMALLMSQAGYAVLVQDSRGRYQSEGEYSWWLEGNDTFDTLSWVAEQSWANGDVGLLGMSISSYPNFLVASYPPPPGVRIKTIIDVMGTIDFHSMFYRDGALVLHWALPWVCLLSPGLMGSTKWQDMRWHELFRHLPLDEVFSALQDIDGDFWKILLATPCYEDFWRGLDVTRRLDTVSVPTLHLSGWYDFMLAQVLATYGALADPTTGERTVHRLVIGPWDHRTLLGSFTHGAADATSEASLDLLRLTVSWLDRFMFVDRSSEAEEGLPQVLLHMPEVGWLGAPSYPCAPVTKELFLVSEDGSAGLEEGAGRLLPRPAKRLRSDTFSYDPLDPVPTQGGAVWPFEVAGLVPGQVEQQPPLGTDRQDVLVYTGDVLTEDLVVLGPVRLKLWAATSAVDTDFTARLLDLSPRGTARIIQDGILRARFRESRAEPTLLSPHRPYALSIDLEHVAHTFRAGHRLRLEISSSNFPKFDRNLNSAELYSHSQALVAAQTVFHGGGMPSRLLLPVLPETEVGRMKVAEDLLP